MNDRSARLFLGLDRQTAMRLETTHVLCRLFDIKDWARPQSMTEAVSERAN